MTEQDYQLAWEYHSRIDQLRKELTDFDKTEVIEIRRGEFGHDTLPEIYRTRREDPALFALVRGHLEEELETITQKLRDL